ncbi:MAG TPA: hypothetical protein VNA19_17910 [Pyrinomonadaceae bacterium]|jgi:hypothetical protein|nr:hypothetical protein [Pyrinomonadaceae bacterium]
MGEFSKWLLHEDQKELFEVLFAIALSIVFIALVALLLWPMGRAWLAFRLAKGYLAFWGMIYLVNGVVIILRRIFRVDIDSHYDVYLISGLVVSGCLQAGWSAFAAPTVQAFTGGAPVWMIWTLYLVGLLSCYVAYTMVSAYYWGQIYRLVNLLLTVVSFIVFSVWPASGRALFGWLFNLDGWLFNLDDWLFNLGGALAR